MYKVLSAVLLITSIIFIVLFSVQYKRCSDLENQLASLNKKTEQLKKETEAVKESSEIAPKKTQSKIPTVPVQPKQEKKKPGIADILKEMQSSPEMREAMRKQQAVFLRQMYWDFIDSLNLTDEQKDEFMELLIEKQITAMDIGMASWNNKEDKSSFQEEFKTLQQELESNLKDILGEANYSEYKEYEKKVPYKMQVNQFKQQLSGDNSLTKNQEESLIQMMSDDSSEYINKFSKPGELPSKDSMAKSLEYKEKQNERWVKSAEPILNPEQLKAFKNQLDIQLSYMRMGAKMFKAMDK